MSVYHSITATVPDVGHHLTEPDKQLS